MANSYFHGLVGKGVSTVNGETTQLRIWGLYHLVGQIVSIFLDAYDCGSATVAGDGSVTFSIGTSTTPTAAQLLADTGSRGEADTPLTITSGNASHSITVSCVIGYGFASQGQVVRPGQGQDVQSPSGPALGKRRRAHQFAALVVDAVAVNFGTDFTSSTLIQNDFTQADGITAIAAQTMYTGVYWSPVTDSYSFDGMLSWEEIRPWPCTINSVTTFLHAEEH